MTIWVDAQLSPAIVPWIEDAFGVSARAVRTLGLRDARDEVIFAAARDADAIVLTKDSDFVRLLEQRGPPPRVIWLTCGNTSNSRLKKVLSERLLQALRQLEAGESLVELTG